MVHKLVFHISQLNEDQQNAGQPEIKRELFLVSAGMRSARLSLAQIKGIALERFRVWSENDVNCEHMSIHAVDNLDGTSAAAATAAARGFDRGFLNYVPSL
jgi:hypothetical protein